MLSQNTTDAAAEKAYRRLRRDLPSWRAVATAPRGRVEAAVRLCGLAEQKAAAIQALLARLENEAGALSLRFLRKLPTDAAMAWLVENPGIGVKTAAVTLLFAFGRAVFPVDTHICRVSGRLGLAPEGTGAARVQALLAPAAPRTARECAQLHLDMIALGRTVCRARRPDCPACPLAGVCRHARRRALRRGN